MRSLQIGGVDRAEILAERRAQHSLVDEIGDVVEQMMLRGEFREDLYYRLKVIEVTVPPLRERRGEISHLTGFFIDRYARRYKRQARQLSEPLAHLFQTYEWPGNIRELENMIKRIVILQDEALVVREMSRTNRPHAAYAAARVSSISTRSHPVASHAFSA